MRALLLFAAIGAAFGQGTKPKAIPEDYPVHSQIDSLGIGAEYMVHSFSQGEEMYLAKDYLVVEVALYPAKDHPVVVQYSDFGLRINGKKLPLLPQAPSMVASSLTHPEFRTEPHPEVAIGAGNRQVIWGAPVPPTVPNGQDPSTRGPQIPRVPKDNPSGMDQREPVKPEELVVQTALPDGIQKWPVSGFLYFVYTGKTSSIKSLELVYGSAALKVR
jgi:hypothetical protein